MWLRLALNILILILLSACSPSDEAAVDKLNLLSYAFHYRNVDSTVYYARQALAVSDGYPAGKAEALNHLAFASMVRMDYQRADSLLADIPTLTDNQIELLVCYVQQMRLCQRRSKNREFYEFREKAISAQKRISEERDYLTEQQRHRLVYAESEMAIVTSTYYYYVGLESQSIEALQQLDADEVRHDTAQYLNYLYNIGAGGILTEGTPEQIHHDEISYLTRCLSIAQRYHYVYFEAQAKEALADHTADVGMAEEALRLFREYGDVYQIAGAYRTLASCHHARGNDFLALEYLEKALADSAIRQAPDLVASIHEQLSVAYAAIDEKEGSDYHRNLYIDLQEQTRQDRELEARAGLLEKAVTQLNWMILAVLIAILLLVSLLWLFNRLNKKRQEDNRQDDRLEQLREAVDEARLRVAHNERHHLEQRAKISLATSILPLIDRILHTVGHQPLTAEHQEYIRELTDQINQQNELLTQWIQLRQGELSLHIESFGLQALFNIVSRSKMSFRMKDITLEVEPTDAVVKADKVLTLFMINTLADNARKFTGKGGTVSIAAAAHDDYVEISVADTGCGMTEEQLAHLFDSKPIHDDDNRQASHGFGLMNCRGIIEKYRKTSRLFSVCQLSAESRPGRGSRFLIRLPKGVLRCLVVGIGLWMTDSTARAENGQSAESVFQLSVADSRPSLLDSAHVYADSAYFSNINGTYRRTLLFADSCRRCLNAYYLQHHPQGKLLMTADGTEMVTPAEIQWLHTELETNYQVVLDIRNESAVAALALHEWKLYEYNNKVYTQLFKELSADATLADYCRTMQQSQSNKRIAVILLLVLLVMIVPAYYILYYRQRLYELFRKERQQQDDIDMAEDALRQAELENANLHVANAVLDNCLSTLKHETMYYPSRIRQLVDSNQLDLLGEVARYYRDLYGILIRQAVEQVERIHLHIKPVELYGQQVLGDENLLSYLFEMIIKETRAERRQTKDLIRAEVKDDRYVVYRVQLVSDLSPLTYYLCRQIVRDHGEATNRRGCGIVKDNDIIIITLPKQNGKI